MSWAICHRDGDEQQEDGPEAGEPVHTDRRLKRRKDRYNVVVAATEGSDLSEGTEALSSGSDGCGDPHALLVASKLLHHSGNYLRHRPNETAASESEGNVFFDAHTPPPLRTLRHVREAGAAHSCLVAEETGRLWRTIRECATVQQGSGMAFDEVRRRLF
jgi:hypothetical protein